MRRVPCDLVSPGFAEHPDRDTGRLDLPLAFPRDRQRGRMSGIDDRDLAVHSEIPGNQRRVLGRRLLAHTKSALALAIKSSSDSANGISYVRNITWSWAMSNDAARRRRRAFEWYCRTASSHAAVGSATTRDRRFPGTNERAGEFPVDQRRQAIRCQFPAR